MFRFLHAADIHLDSPLKGLTAREGAPVDRIRRATRMAMENLVRTAIDRQVDFVVISGDVFDTGLDDAHTGQFFLRQMRKLREAGIPVVMIRGNHDAKDSITLSLPKQDRIFVLNDASPQSLSADELGIEVPVTLHGQSYSTRHVQENVAAGYPARHPDSFHLGLLHTSLDQIGSGHDVYAPCVAGDLERLEYDYWALGHIHLRSIQRRGQDGGPWIVFPGNVQGRHARERGAKGCLLVEVDDRNRCGEPEFIPLDVVRWEECRVVVTPQSTADDLESAFCRELLRLQQDAEGRLLAARVQIVGECNEKLLRRWSGATEQLAQHLRLTATAAAGDEVWLEKIQWQAAPKATQTPEVDQLAVGEILQVIGELGRTPEFVAEMKEALGELRNKLPADMIGADSPDAIRIDDPDWIVGQMSQAQALLAAKLGEASE